MAVSVGTTILVPHSNTGARLITHVGSTQIIGPATRVLPDAVAPTQTLTDITTITEGQTASITAMLSGGTYDESSYMWAVRAGGGTLDSGIGVLTSIGVLVSANVILRGLVSHNGVMYLANNNDASLYTVNTTTGAATRVGDFRTTTISGIGNMASHNGALYLIGSGTDRNLYTVNTTTGAATRVGSFGIDGITNVYIASHNGVLYAIGATRPGNFLYTVNPATGEFSAVGSSLLGEISGHSSHGLESHDGELYLMSSRRGSSVVNVDTLYTVNVATGVATFLANMNVTRDQESESLASHQGVLYTLDRGSKQLYSIRTDSTNMAVYDPADISVNTSVTVRCVTTVRGTGTNAKDGTSATVTTDETFTVTPVADRPGTLSVTVTQSGRNYNFVMSVTDPDGIRSLTTATVTSRDGRQASVLGDFSRSDANTFAGTDSRRNARWSSGTLTVVYVESASGSSRTLTQTWTT